MNLVMEQASYVTPEEPRAELLSRISFSAELGTVTLLAGCTGSGKSTLLQLLAGLKEPSSGRIAIGSCEQRGEAAERQRLLQSAGYVHQYPEHQFFLPKVRDELLYALRRLRLAPAERNRRLSEALNQCGIGEELLEQSPFLLSGGQKRRVAIASAVIARPEWLLLDEPTAGLDSDMACWLAGRLSEWKREKRELGRGGIIVASHDLDLFLPVADQVVLLQEGASLGTWSPSELMREPAVLKSAGLGVPACIRLASFAGAAGLGVESAADALEAKWRGGGLKAGAGGGHTSPRRQEPEEGQPVSIHAGAAPNRSAGRGNLRFSRLKALDPRAKWLVYLMFSLSLLIKPQLAVSAAGLILAGAVAVRAGLPGKKWLKPLKAMGFFIALAFLIAGLQLRFGPGSFPLSGTRFSMPEALEALRRLAPLLPVLAGGAVFNACTSPLSIQKGLDAPLRRIPRFERGAEAIGLAVALMFRFLRFIPEELERFALLASVRGRAGTGKPGKLRVRQLPSFLTPMLLSVMQHAEELALALEARGYGRKGVKRTNAAPLRWRREDGAACLAGVGVVALLLGLRWLTG